MYKSKYYTCEEIDERLLKGYYDDAVSNGYSDTFEQFKIELASLKDIADNKANISNNKKDIAVLSKGLSDEIARSMERDVHLNTEVLQLDSRVLELEKSQWPLELTLGLSSELLEYTNEFIPISVNYSVKHKGELKVPITLTLTKDGVDVGASVTSSSRVTLTVNKLGITEFILTATAHSYYDNNSEETSDIIESTISKKLQMVLPIYAGFGTSATSVKTDANKLSVRTSAVGTYSATCKADGQNYFILVPVGFGTLTSFTMGGAPFVMETSNITLGDYQYKQYKSGAVYNTGAIVNIKVS